MSSSRLVEGTERPSGKPGDSFVEAFAKGLAVITAFNAGGRSLSIAEVAERTDVTRAGARRLLHTLVGLGYARVNNGRFELTPRIIQLGRAYLLSAINFEESRPVVERLSQDTGELCTMSVLDGLDVVYVVRIEPFQPLTRGLGVGSRLPAYATSMGRVLMAGLPEDEAKSLLERSDRRPLTSFTKTRVPALMTEISHARQNGWAFVSEELEYGVCGLSAGVKDVSGSIRSVVSISFNLARFDKKRALRIALPRLLEAARQLSNSR